MSEMPSRFHAAETAGATGTSGRRDEREDGTVAVRVVPPFDLALTVAVLRRRASHAVEVFEGGEYRRVLTLAGGRRLVGLRQTAPDLVELRGLDGPLASEERRAAAGMAGRMLGLGVDMAAVRRAFAEDARLAPLVERLAGMKPPRFESLWVTLLSVVPFQQVSLDAGMAVLNRVITRFGPTLEHEGRTYYAFPTLEQWLGTEPEALRGCGLSAAKVRTLTGAAAMLAEGTLREEEIEAASDEEAVARLTALPGIGPWSAHVILLRGFRRLSFFPEGDSGAARNLNALFELPGRGESAEARAIVERLGVYRGYLYYVLLAWKLLATGAIETSELSFL